ncbi:neurotrophin 1 [Amyelois transitella]|uniref:neurotrophin 1 n=1 Tax=Amyelois transitella TaxID=680683 RepID=UPI00298FEE37|nr:neurotrophin 1 [Amyelois transitella]
MFKIMLRISAVICAILVASQGLSEPSYVPQVSPSGEPSCARGRTYCEKIADYPRDTILQLVKAASNEMGIFLSDKHLVLDHEPHKHLNFKRTNTSSTLKMRDEQLCEAVIRIIKPLVARNERNEWRYIVNVQHNEQILEIEYCKHIENKCKMEFRNDIHSRCEQKMMTKRLLALDPSGRKLIWHDTMLPSCCQCVLYDVPRKH